MYLKKIIFTLVSLFILLSVFSQDRKFNLYPGVTLDAGAAIPFPFSDIPSGAAATPKINPSAGLGVIYSFSEKWNFASEINYHKIDFSAKAEVVSQSFTLGSNAQMYFTGKTETEVAFQMIEIPLIGLYKIREDKNILLGGYYAFILNSKFSTKGINGVYSPDKNITDNAQLPGPEYTVSYNFNNSMENYDFGVLVGYSQTLYKKISVWSKLNVGLKNIFKDSFNRIDYKMYQIRFNLGLSYMLFS